MGKENWTGSEKFTVELIDCSKPVKILAVKLRRKVLRVPLGLDFTPEELEAENADLHVGLFERGELVGVLILTTLDETRVKMRQVAIEPDRQGEGLGRILVQASETIARERGFERIVLSARANVVGFYESLGYEVVGEPYEEVTIPHRWMEKAL